MTTKRKVRADFDNSQPISVNVSGCSEDIKKQVIQAFFDVWLYWTTDDRNLSPTDYYVSSYGNVCTRGENLHRLMWGSVADGITPEQFFAMVYEDEPQGHPHAELMMAYAEDAKTHAEPWKLWQLKNKKQLEWFDCSFNPNWDIDLQYRRKIKTHLVHGVEVPDLRINAEAGKSCFVVSPLCAGYYDSHVFTKCELSNDYRWAEQGLCYEHTEVGKQAAILHAKAMLGIAQQEQS